MAAKAKKVVKKAAKKVVKKAAKKVAKKVAKKPVKKVVKKAVRKPEKKPVRKPAKKPAKPARPFGGAVSTAKPRKAYAAKLKTVKTSASVEAFLSGLPDPQQRADAEVLARIFANATHEPPRMWGSAIVGYGDYSYVGRSGRSGDFFLCGFSPRKGKFALYALGSFVRQTELLDQLGAHAIGGGCLYIKRLADVDASVLKTLVQRTYARAKALAPGMMNQGAL